MSWEHLPRRLRARGRKSRYAFTSYFEERKILEYLGNLIDSRFLNSETEALFGFAWTALGKKTIIDIIKLKHPEVIKRRQFKDAIELDAPMDDDEIPTRVMKTLLREEVAALIVKRLKKLSSCREPEIETRLSTLQKTFDLTTEEIEIISLCYLLETAEIVEDFLGSRVADFADISVFRNHGDILLGLDREAFLSAVAKGNLFKAEIIKKSGGNSLEITSWCADYLSGLTKADLSHEFFSRGNDETLEVSDFNLQEDDLLVLDTLIKSSDRQNILLYGAPGTGKSSFAKSLAKKYDKELFSVKTPETDEHKDRLRAIFATVTLADKDTSIILVDEADEVINSYKSFFFESKTNKSWINQFLESHNKKVIWITNRSGEIDPSTMRRFSFSIEFKKLDRKNRLKVLKYEFSKKGMEGYLSDEELSDLCKTYNVDAGGIVNAINTLNITGDTDKETALRKIRAVLKSHEKATGGKRNGNQKEREFDTYSLEGLNTSRKLGEIVAALKPQADHPAKKNISIALLLHGLPGTGKSEFVYYLGHELGKEVLLKRASNIQSKWVGESEKNIANAFAEAQENNNLLFFDEADTFLFPRRSAQTSWEISFTNEILTQLESFKGIVVFATNDMEGLDHAALRRFKFKIEFRPLKPEGNLQFYNKLLRPLVSEERDLSSGELTQLKNISGLTPGDFAVVKDQFMFVDPSAVTHEKLIEALLDEVRHKISEKGIKGFTGTI